MEILHFLYHNYVVLVVAYLFIIYELIWKIGMSGKFKATPFTGIAIAGSLYPMAKIAQLTVLGPNAFRWYGADVSFLPFVLLMFILITIKEKPDFKKSYRNLLMLSTLITIIIIAHEFFQIYSDTIYDKNLSGIKGFTGRGDKIDIIAYLVSYVATLFFLQTIRKIIIVRKT